MDKEIIVCTIDFRDLLERYNNDNSFSVLDEAIKVNLENKAKVCNIKVKGSEGIIPHFHIESVSTSFHSCVCIYVPKYFTHLEGEEQLVQKQKTILDSVLRFRLDNGTTYWDQISNTWKAANEQSRNTLDSYLKKRGLDPKNLIQPDYTHLSGSEHN